MRNFLFLFLVFLPNFLLSQCEVFIEPNSVIVTDNGSGINFTFDVTNNSPDLWYGDVLKLAWTLNSSAPIWEIDYTTNTNQPPIAPGETRTIKTPWFDFPNLPSWFPNDPNASQPWVESMEWAYYSLPFPFEGAWSPMRLRLGSCGLANATTVYDSNGDYYYGPFNSDCPDLNNDAFCDCDIDFIGFDPNTLDVSVEVISHWNCGTTLNNGASGNVDAINHIHFGLHVPGWDYQWGCTTGINHPGWTFTGWSANGNSNVYLYSGDVLNINLLDLGPNAPCFQEILTSDTLTACPEIVLWQINYSQTLNIADGGWAINYGGDDTQEYPDNFINLNSLNICNSPPPLYPGCMDENANNYNSNAGYDDGSCLYGPVLGCTDPTACNYDPSATSNDGSCDYSCIGCMDESASNYNPNAIYNNNSCEYFFPDADPSANFTGYECNGTEVETTYSVFVYNFGEDTLFQYCVEIPELGFDECFNGFLSGNLWVEPGGGQFITTLSVPSSITQFTIIVYNVVDEYSTDNVNNIQVVNVNIPNENFCNVIELTYLDITPIFGCDIIEGGYYIPEIAYENTGNVTINEFCATYDIYASVYDEEICWEGILEPGEIVYLQFPPAYNDGIGAAYVQVNNINGSGGGWTEVVSNINYAAIADDQCIYGCTIVQACNYNPEATVNDGSCDFESCVGCMDPDASNYNPEATINNPNLCVYDVLGCTDETAFNYNPLATVDDGSCIPVIVGCMIPEALNYNPEANITCVPIDECCVFPVEGCTDPEAINYTPEANVDDGSCEYDVFGCTDPLATNYNPLATVNDGSCEYIIYLGGCTDPEAINYNVQATYDDGSCVYDPCNGVIGAVYYAPNTFTPNNDGINDGWTVLTNPECWLKWQVLIYNRWGQLIWESTTPGEVWPGSTFDGGYYVADGVYFYKVIGVGWNPANTFQTTGNITIFR